MGSNSGPYETLVRWTSRPVVDFCRSSTSLVPPTRQTGSVPWNHKGWILKGGHPSGHSSSTGDGFPTHPAFSERRSHEAKRRCAAATASPEKFVPRPGRRCAGGVGGRSTGSLGSADLASKQVEAIRGMKNLHVPRPMGLAY